MPGGTFAVFSLYIWAAKVQRWNTCLPGVTSATPAMHIYIYAVKFAKMQKWDFPSCRRIAGHGLGTTFATPAMDI